MNIARSLLDIPTIPLLFLLMLFFAASTIAIKYIVIRFRRGIGIPKGFSEVVGNNYLVVGAFYGLLFAFVISDTLDSFSEAQMDAEIEGSYALSLYRQINSYPDSTIAPDLKKAYLKYVKLVIEDEFPKMSLLQKSDSTNNAFIKVFELVEQLRPMDDYDQDKAISMMQNMNELFIYRNMRIFTGDYDIPVYIYLTLFIGWFIIALLASLLNIENLSRDWFVNCLVGAFVGLMFFLIIIMDHPFAGSIRVEPGGYYTILNM